MARALRRARVGPLALPALVGASTIAHWLAGRRLSGLWIMPDEAIYARRAFDLWHHATLPLLHGEGAGYGVLYPVVAGLPLSVGTFAHGYASLKLLQALVVSLAAVPVFVYGRRLMPPIYAFLAAALTLASPLLLYSGLVMTEVVYYPVAAAALLAVARAVETAAARDEAIALAWIAAAVLTRVQAIVFVAVFAAAILVDALAARDRTRLRRFWPVWTVTLAGGALAASSPGIFGSYAGTLRGSYPLGRALGLVADHAALLALTTGVVPALALLLLLVGGPLDRRARAFLVTCACAIVLVVVQVAFFAARFAPHLLERDLASLPPLLFLVFALWLSRGAPLGNRYAAGALAFALLALLLLAPWHRLAVLDAFPDSFSLAPLLRVDAVDAVTALGIVLVGAALLVPRRSAPLLAVLVGTVLVLTSVLASNRVAAAVARAQASIVGSDPDWIDTAAGGRVAFVYVGEAYWNTVWEETFWNRRVQDVLTLAPASVPGPLPQTSITVPRSGRLPTRDRYVVANDRLSFVGSPIAHLAQSGLDVSGLTLWRLAGAPRLSTAVNGVLANGDMVGPAIIQVYDCRAGRLELTLLPKATRVLTVLFDGVPVLRADVAGQKVWHGSIPARPSPTSTVCRFTIEGDGLLGSTRIEFVR